MSIQLYQFDGANVPPLVDARLYEMLSGGTVGIVQGCEITHLGGNQLKITSGWGICKGRVFQIQQQTVNATVSTSGKVRGRLLVDIDVSNREEPCKFATQAQEELPELIQENINLDGTIYQMPLTEYNVDEISISDLTVVAPKADFTRMQYSVTVTLLASGWQGEQIPYTQQVEVEGMTGDWIPGAPIAVPGDLDNQGLIDLREGLSFVGKIESQEGYLVFTCPEEKPAVDMTLRIPGVM